MAGAVGPPPLFARTAPVSGGDASSLPRAAWSDSEDIQQRLSTMDFCQQGHLIGDCNKEHTHLEKQAIYLEKH
jgi:hypothetical protein